MKRILLIMTACSLFFSACAQKKTENPQNNDSMKKTLVAYFSATGTTNRAAEQLAKEHNADLFEIAP